MNANEIVRKLRLDALKHGEDVCLSHVAADLIESLLTQLAESRRRERAAVADLKHDDNCDICAHQDACGDDCYGDCAYCKRMDCVCKDCRNESKWQWRGPVAGEVTG